ncbi:MAG: transcriptional repressor [Phycisphaerales bacterium]|nr:MAG: transcriptional repressor [Phycisphaerales bacterium]
MSNIELDRKTERFIARCRANGLKVTPQRIAIYRGLVDTDEHPSAEMLHEKVKKVFPGISLDTVNRTLLTLSEIGAASVVEGSGDARRFDGDSEKHQHFKCVQCKRIVDFHHKAFDRIKVPVGIARRFTILSKSVYLEGICDLCRRR